MLRDLPRAVVVVPCYNEGSRLQSDLFAGFILERPHLGFCFVDDGSRDDTLEVLRALEASVPGQVVVVALPDNRGKAEAVRAGITTVLQSGQAHFVGYWDADLATPLGELDVFLEVVANNPGVQVVMGSRIQRLGARVTRRAMRHYLGRIFATIVSYNLKLKVYDTQCGAKLIESRLAAELFHLPFASRWLFDVELLMRAICSSGLEVTRATTVEVPLREWRDVGASKLRVTDYFKAPLELFRMFSVYGDRLRAASTI